MGSCVHSMSVEVEGVVLSFSNTCLRDQSGFVRLEGGCPSLNRTYRDGDLGS